MSTTFFHLVNIFLCHDNSIDIFCNLIDSIDVFCRLNNFNSLYQNLIIREEVLRKTQIWIFSWKILHWVDIYLSDDHIVIIFHYLNKLFLFFMEMIYLVPNNEKYDMKINFSWKNIFHRKWYSGKTIFHRKREERKSNSWKFDRTKKQ